jgi:predicted nuclease of predicted toxin-antitoxin system
MGLRFFSDHCVPNSVGEALKEAGHEVFQLRDQLPTDTADPAVIAKAQELGAILVSLNGDFADIVSYPPANYKGIVALQVKNHPEVIPLVIAKLKEYLTANPDPTHYEGKLLILEPHRIRIRSSK